MLEIFDLLSETVFVNLNLKGYRKKVICGVLVVLIKRFSPLKKREIKKQKERRKEKGLILVFFDLLLRLVLCDFPLCPSSRL